MSSNGIDVLQPAGIPPRRKKRWEAKKRKIEAFLNLINSEQENDTMKKSKTSETDKPRSIEDDFKAMLEMREHLRRKQNEAEPTFHLTEHGIKAQVNFTFYNKDKPLGQTVAPLFVEDVQHLLLRGVIGVAAPVTTRWCKIVRERNLSHVVLFIIDGISKNSVVNNASSFPKLIDTFPNIVEIVTPDSYSLNFATELCGVHLTLGHNSKVPSSLGICNSFKSITSMFPTETKEEKAGDVSFSKLHLLLSPIQLVMENFPLPKSVFEGSKSEGYCFTKSVYAHVTPSSPVFALDCEMCRMQSGQMAVTRLAVIDENCKTVYYTLVKPEGVVSDYLTKYSGVTKEMLSPVKTTLKDVQKTIDTLLPPDAILCGQSLNFDLHALKMIHPYVIDTSVIYNTSGCRSKKSGLRVLSDTFLNEEIQQGKDGHDPVEDCLATMKLVLLKLQNGPQFGDAILSGSRPFMNRAKILPNAVKESAVSVSKPWKTDVSTSFFSKIQSQTKTTCIVASEKTQSHYPEEMIPGTVKRLVKEDTNKIIKRAIRLMDKHFFTICHININSEEKSPELYSKIDDYIQRLHIACADKCLFVAIASGLSEKNNDDSFENALCMVTIKNNQP